MKVTAPHQWTQPKCGAGDLVYAEKHKGGPAYGKVIRVETGYDKNRACYHAYWIAFLGLDRHQWLGDEKIYEVTERAGEH